MATLRMGQEQMFEEGRRYTDLESASHNAS